MPVRRRTQASARLAAQHVGAKRLATPSQALSTIAYTDRLSRSAPYADPPKHCSERCVPQRRKPASLFHHRAASTLLAIEIEMVSGLRRAARGRVASPLRGAEGADAASRRLKLAVLAVHPDVNRPSPASIGRVASSSGLAAVACGPDAPVEFPPTEWSVQSIWMGRPEPRDANGLAGIVVGDGCPWAASH